MAQATGLQIAKDTVIEACKPKNKVRFPRRTVHLSKDNQQHGVFSSTYEATLPDGTVVRKQSCDVHQDAAILGCYEYRAEWMVGLIYAEITTAPLGTGLTLVQAERVSVRAQRTPILWRE